MNRRKKTPQPARNEGSEGLDARVTELVAIGASIAGHCQPCLAYHVAKAKELGVADEHIQAAMAVGHRVEKGAMSAMREFARSATGAPPKEMPACCGGTPSKDRETCCG